jgi:hypothetical protein
LELQLTRRQVYELVWTKPLNKIAAELGLSDQGLAKACRRFQIAVPPVGYWQKLAFGKQVHQPALDCEHFDENVEVQVMPGVKMRTKRSAPAPAAQKISVHDEVQQPERPKPEPQKAPKLHPIISEVSQQFRSKRRSEETVYINAGPFTIHASPGEGDRIVNILSMFFECSSDRGLVFRKDGAAWKLYASEESIDIKMSEGLSMPVEFSPEAPK